MDQTASGGKTNQAYTKLEKPSLAIILKQENFQKITKILFRILQDITKVT